jgi:hypothetical protein
LDDLTILQEMNADGLSNSNQVFKMRDAYLISGSRDEKPKNAGLNPMPGAILNFWLAKEPDTNSIVKVKVLDKDGKSIKTFSSSEKDKDLKIQLKKGLNQFNWDFSYPVAEKLEGLMLWNGSVGGPTAAPGAYSMRIFIEKDSLMVPFNVVRNPEISATDEDLVIQHSFLIQIRDKFSELIKTLKDNRDIRNQINQYSSKLGDKMPITIKDSSQVITKQLMAIDDALHQNKIQANQDMLNFPIRLDDKLAGLYNVVSNGNNRPSEQSREVFKQLSAMIDEQIKQFDVLKSTKISALNSAINQSQLPVIIAK